MKVVRILAILKKKREVNKRKLKMAAMMMKKKKMRGSQKLLLPLNTYNYSKHYLLTILVNTIRPALAFIQSLKVVRVNI